MAPRGAQESSRDILREKARYLSALFEPILGTSWAILGPPWPFLGGPRGHLEANVGLGRLELGVQGGKRMKCQTHQKKTKECQCFWLISFEAKEP